MLTRLLVLAAASLTLVAADPSPCPEPEDASKADLKKFQGAWTVVKAVKDGKGVGAELAHMRMEIKDQKLILKDNRRDEVVGIKIDARKNPREITILPDRGEKPVEGIYRLEKDELTIAFGPPGGTRPKQFDEKVAGLLVFKRGGK